MRGKRIALNRGSNVHNLLVRVLAANGMSVTDVHAIYLSPSDARAAFESASVDAWAIWDPYLATAETALPPRKIADGVTPDSRVMNENREFFLAARDYARVNHDVIATLMLDLTETGKYVSAHHAEVVSLLAPAMRMETKAVQRAIDRLAVGVAPVTQRTSHLSRILLTCLRVCISFR